MTLAEFLALYTGTADEPLVQDDWPAGPANVAAQAAVVSDDAALAASASALIAALSAFESELSRVGARSRS